jgi:peroxiredoxin Q/BCP
MRDDYEIFNSLGTEIVVISLHEKGEMQTYWQKEALPFIGIADPEGSIAKRFGQQRKRLSLGPLPAQFLIDCQGKIALSHYGANKSDIITNELIIEKVRRVRLDSNCPERPATKGDEDDDW